MSKNEDKSILSQVAQLDLYVDEIMQTYAIAPSAASAAEPTVMQLISAKITQIAAKIAAQSEKIVQLQNEKLLALATVENLKKQWYQEKDQLQKYRSKFLGQELLNFIDNFELALNYQSASAEVSQFLKGFQMMHQMVLNSLAAEGIVVMPTKIGDPFDHNLHNALEQIKDEAFASQTIIKIIKKGYYLHDNVLRHASVIVSE